MKTLSVLLAILCAAPLCAAGEVDQVEPGVPAEAAAVRADEPAETPPVAPEEPYSRQVGLKLKRGVVNVLRAGTEIYVQPMAAAQASGRSISMLWPGIGEACGMFMTRLFGGIIEAATCAVPIPNGWQPLLDE